MKAPAKRTWTTAVPFTIDEILRDKTKLVSSNRLLELMASYELMIIQQTRPGDALKTLNGWIKHYTQIDIPFAVFRDTWPQSGKAFYGIIKERVVEDLFEPED